MRPASVAMLDEAAESSELDSGRSVKNLQEQIQEQERALEDIVTATAGMERLVEDVQSSMREISERLIHLDERLQALHGERDGEGISSI